MAIEMGAKTGLFEADGATEAWVRARSTAPYAPVAPDPDAGYALVREYDLAAIGPVVARPGRVDDVVPIEAVAGHAASPARSSGPAPTAGSRTCGTPRESSGAGGSTPRCGSS